jgi:hypothetical protein
MEIEFSFALADAGEGLLAHCLEYQDSIAISEGVSSTD